jgi:hypothetical protein
MSTFEWNDPDDGQTYEMRYIVTQSEDEGPEYVEWRVKPKVKTAGKAYEVRWEKLPPWATPPEEAIEYWHGKVSKFDPNTSRDVNDLYAAIYRLTRDLKRLELIPKEFKAVIE